MCPMDKRWGWYQRRPIALETKALQALALALGVFAGIVDPNAVSFKEPVEFVARFNPEKLLQLWFGEPVLPVLVSQPRFPRPMRQISARGGFEPHSDIIGDSMVRYIVS